MYREDMYVSQRMHMSDHAVACHLVGGGSFRPMTVRPISSHSITIQSHGNTISFAFPVVSMLRPRDQPSVFIQARMQVRRSIHAETSLKQAPPKSFRPHATWQAASNVPTGYHKVFRLLLHRKLQMTRYDTRPSVVINHESMLACLLPRNDEQGPRSKRR